MEIEIITANSSNSSAWDQYVDNNPEATLYHRYGWKEVVERTYGHKTYCLMAVKKQKKTTGAEDCVVGILLLIHLKHIIFGNQLVSMPYFDMGGILADNTTAEIALLSKAVTLGKKLKAGNIELRHKQPLSCLSDDSRNKSVWNNTDRIQCSKRSDKVRMLLDLFDTPEEMMKSFKSKLRSQIKKPIKAGLKATVGGPELLEDFYRVFLVNMRDLGSPVHSNRLMRNIFELFPNESRMVVVYKADEPVASSLIVGIGETLENPWASSLRQYSRLSPNMLLYWTMLEYACDHGYKYFDFGRSTPGEGTYKFKAQWGAVSHQLHWHYIYLNGRIHDKETTEQTKFDRAIQYWKKLPVPVTRIIGPMIRKYISL